nr:GFA family protein [uncultured Devosia sp.]
MGENYAGGCACGAIRYEVAGEPVAMNDCQCRQCQRDSGSGHASYMTFVGADVALAGMPSSWDFTGDGGTVKRRAFCPDCGTPVYMTFPAMPDVFVLRAGSLDDPSRYKPDMVYWTETAQAWDHLDPAVVKFARMPPG